MSMSWVRARDGNCVPEPDYVLWYDMRRNLEWADAVHEEQSAVLIAHRPEEKKIAENEVNMLSSDVIKLLAECQKGGFYQKLGILKYIQKHKRSSTERNQRSQYYPHLLTDILDPFQQLDPSFSLMWSLDYFAIFCKKMVYMVKLHHGLKLIVKIIEYSQDNTKAADYIRNEYFIGHTLGGMSKYIAQTYSIREVAVDSNKIRVEMLMEYGGSNIDDRIYDNGNDAHVVIAYQLSQVLAFLGERGVAHLDIKPNNIVWDLNTSLLNLIDFATSIAYYRTPSKIRLPFGEEAHRIIEFTAYYAAPEVMQATNTFAAAQLIIPQQAEVFSFGMTVWDLLQIRYQTNRWNHHYKYSKSEHNQFIKHINKKLIEWNKCEWKELLDSCLSYNPSKRPSFREVCNMMNSIARHAGILNQMSEAQCLSLQEHQMFAIEYSELNEPEIALWHHEEALYREYGTRNNLLAEDVSLTPLLNVLKRYIDKLTRSDTIQVSISLTEGPLCAALQIAETYRQIKIEQKKVLRNSTRLSHSSQFQSILKASSSPDSPGIVSKLTNLGYVCYQIQEYQNAIEYYQLAATRLIDALGINHVDLIPIYCNMAKAYLKLSNLETALKIYQIIDGIVKYTHLTNNVSISDIYNKMGHTYAKKADYTSAIKYYQDAERLLLLADRTTNVGLAGVYLSLGNAYLELADNQKAIHYYQLSEHILITQNKVNPIDIAQVYHKLGDAYTELSNNKDYDNRAIEYLQKARRHIISAHGPDHPNIADISMSFNRAYFKLSKYNESIEYWQEASRIPLSPELSRSRDLANAHSRRNLANVFTRMSDDTTASNCYSEAEKMLTLAYGVNHTTLANASYSLGKAYDHIGDSITAIKFYQISCQCLGNAHGPGCIDILQIYLKVGKASFKLGDYTRATEFYHKAELIIVATKKSYDIALGRIYSKLGRTYFLLANNEKALDYYEKANRRVMLVYGSHHLKFARLCKSSGDASYKLSNYQTALYHYRVAANIIQEHCALDHVDDADLADLLYCLGITCSELSEYQLALDYFLKAKPIFAALYEGNSIEVVMLYLRMTLQYLFLYNFHQGFIYLHETHNLIVPNQQKHPGIFQVVRNLLSLYPKYRAFDNTDEPHLS